MQISLFMQRKISTRSFQLNKQSKISKMSAVIKFAVDCSHQSIS